MDNSKHFDLRSLKAYVGGYKTVMFCHDELQILI